MPKLVSRLPKYRRRKPENTGFVVIDGVRRYLPGRYNSAESKAEYHRLVQEWVARGRPQVATPTPSKLTVARLLVLYVRFAEGHYRKDGAPTEEMHCLRMALRPLRELYDATLAAEFGPVRFKAVRERMVALGWSRTTVNRMCGRIRQLFRWASSEELLPASIWEALRSVPGLQRGRTNAKESSPVLPVSEETVRATLPFLPAVVADMVRLQQLTGMRPAEVCIIRPGDIDRTADVWRFKPSRHKTEHVGRDRVVYLGPQSQEILRPYLLRPAAAFCFSPAESSKRSREKRHEARTTPLAHGNAPGRKWQPSSSPRVSRKSGRPGGQPGERYDVDAYRRAIGRACEVAFGMPARLRRINKTLPAAEREQLRAAAAAWRRGHCWRPNQLRHAAGTKIRAEFGTEAARTVLGHAEMSTTQIYAERDERLAEKVAMKLG